MIAVVEPGTGDAAAADLRNRRARVGVIGAYMVQGFAFAALLTQVPALQEKFHLSDGALTLILLAVPVVAGVGSVLAGALAPRLGSGLVLRIANPAVCLAIALIGFVPTRIGLYIAVAAFGLVIGAVDATMNMQGVVLERRYRRSLLSSFYGFWSVAGILGSLATALTSVLHMSLAASLGCVAVIGIVASLVVGPRLLRPDETHDIEQAQATEAAAAAKSIPWKPIVLVGIAVTLMYISDSATTTWSAEYLHKLLHAANAVAALGLGAYMAMQVTGRFVAHRIAPWVGPVPMVAAGALIGAAGMTLVATAPNAAVAIGGFAVLGFGLSPIVPLSFSVAGAHDPTGSGVAVARVNLFNYLGFVVGAALIGSVEQLGGYRVAFAVPAALAVLIVALARTFRTARPEAA
jgi:MFS family permease